MGLNKEGPLICSCECRLIEFFYSHNTVLKKHFFSVPRLSLSCLPLFTFTLPLITSPCSDLLTINALLLAGHVHSLRQSKSTDMDIGLASTGHTYAWIRAPANDQFSRTEHRRPFASHLRA